MGWNERAPLGATAVSLQKCGGGPNSGCRPAGTDPCWDAALRAPIPAGMLGKSTKTRVATQPAKEFISLWDLLWNASEFHSGFKEARIDS